MSGTTTAVSGARHIERRLTALRRFAIAITVLNVLGYTVLGFEQSWAHPAFALAAAYATELILETVDARANRRKVRFAGSPRKVVDFLLSAHISGLAVSMLLYPNARITPVVFAAVAAIGSKAILRVSINGARRHVFNPSNLGITLTLIAFPFVGIAPPYQFTENLNAFGGWLLPAIIVTTGSLLNGRLTGRMPLVAGWLSGFVAQAAVRASMAGGPVEPALVPMTGVAFVLYTFYMVTDPATTPERPWAQVAFGIGVAAAYGALISAHIVFGLFFGLTIVSAVRGTVLWATSRAAARVPSREPVREPVQVAAQVAIVSRGGGQA